MFYLVHNTLGIIASRICTLPRDIGNKAVTAENLITNQLEIGILRIINADENNTIIRQQLLQQLQPGIHHAQPFIMTGQVLALFANNLAQPLLDLRVIDIVVVAPALVAGVVGRIYVPTDFDTIEKAFSGVKTAEKGIKQGLSRSNADFGSPCLLYSVMDFCHSRVRPHRGV